MKITNVDTIRFKTTSPYRAAERWIGIVREPTETVQTITKIETDEGVEGYMIGGDKATNERYIKPLIMGENPLDREKIWNWMDQLCTNRGLSWNVSEMHVSAVDCALWDLYGRMVGLPVHKLLGGCRNKVKAYASSCDHIGTPEDYAEHAVSCKKQGYKAYKIHPYVSWNPYTMEPAPLIPAFPKEDVDICKAVRKAVGDDMVLLLDNHGGYSFEESLWVGRELEKLDFYWLECPMLETRTDAYRRLSRELRIAVLAPECAPGGLFNRAEWVKQDVSDMSRTDWRFGGITGMYKLATLCQAYGMNCELHGGGWANIQILGAMPEATCEYYERGLLQPGVDYETPAPYLETICDPMDDDGNVIVPTTAGLGMEFNWEYIKENIVKP